MSTAPTKLEEPPRKKRLAARLFVVFLLVLIVVLVGAVRQMLRTFDLMRIHNDVHWVSLALHRYHDQHGHFPPVVEIDEQGKPKHSWRTLIEPSLETSDTHFRLSSYDFAQPWDGEANRASIHEHRFGDFPFQLLAVVGPHAAWSPTGPRKFEEFKDGAGNTIMVIGVRDTGIAWNDPRDAVFDGTDILINGRRLEPNQRIFAIFADGTVRYGIYHQNMTPFFTIDAGDTVPEW